MLIHVPVYTRPTNAFRRCWNNFLPGTVCVLYDFAFMTCPSIYNHEPVHIAPIVEIARSVGRMSTAPWIIAGLTPFSCCYDTARENCFFKRVQSGTGTQPATCSVGVEVFFFCLEATATGVWSCLRTTVTFMAWCVIRNSASAHFTFYEITLRCRLQGDAVAGDTHA